MAEKIDTIRRLKHESLACFLASDPTTVPVPTARAVIAGKPTLNHAFLTSIILGVACPNETFTVGKGWAGDKHGAIYATPGERWEGRGLSGRAILAERTKGRHGGGREDGGYGDEYRTGYFLNLRHGEAGTVSAIRLLRLSLLIDYLLTVPGTGDVIEIGGRATGGKSWHGSILQAQWRGETVEVPAHDWATSCQMFGQLTPTERDLIGPAPGSITEAVEMLEAIPAIVLPARFEWWGDEEGEWWRAQVNRERSWFVQKRTGETSLMATGFDGSAQGHGDHLRDKPVEGHAWHLSITEDGLAVHRRPGGSDPPAPPPDPAPEDGKPDLHYLDEGDELALALVKWGDEHGFHPARKQGREIRRAIFVARKRQREETKP